MAIAWVVWLSKRDCGKPRPCSIIDDVLPVTSDPRPSSRFFACNIKKLGGWAWVRGYFSVVKDRVEHNARVIDVLNQIQTAGATSNPKKLKVMLDVSRARDQRRGNPS